MATTTRIAGRAVLNVYVTISSPNSKILEYSVLTDPGCRPLRTYNVTKADARPVLSEHHKISWDEKKVLVPWEEGKTSNLDHCQCSECRHPETKQRLIDTFSIPPTIQAAEVETQEKGLKITWKNDKHESFYPYEWLHLHSYNPRLQKYLSPQFRLWGAEIGERPPEISYKEVIESDKGVAKWTSKIYTYGFSYVNDVPVSPEATQKLVERIALIRHTHYGGFWDFTADLAKKDTAYTDLPLAVHTDNTYFSDPAGLQLLHLLEHKGDGGMTLLVDGFKAARILRDEYPDSYRILSNVRVPSHASGNAGISIQPFAPFPVLNHHPVDGELMQIRWNNDDRATMDNWGDSDEVDRFYEAMRHWDVILSRRDVEYREQLVPGRALIFDNWRVLHGRTSFTGFRRMCGAYVNRDDFISRFLMTNTKREVVLNAV
ncbi:Trimethyllysine dioxygenase [Terfezia boudieri ATCC MYA-4762]|uniref:trimethyllysine dioxygenase n=1 Tax=Terfezia boudieri ATCC MYA-4762 TaxID=1051890 RepID=A0A3N4LDU3_9PEZI|nr:Trimethyllysine dioxygenase [Terfezia boudieri ATCC MYA-4762]